jgi:excisionase family DNA binding protein
MGMTDEDRRFLKGGEPFGVKPLEAGRLIGESRNTVYRLLAAGKLRAVKRGTSTLVLMDSIREHVASLPAAVFLPRN